MTPEPQASGGRRPGRNSLRVVAGPLVTYFDKRFQDLHDRIDDRMNKLYDRVATEVETMSEMTLVMQRFVDLSGDQVDDLVGRMGQLCDSLERQHPELDAAVGTASFALESAFAVAAVARLPTGARILHVAGDAGVAGLSAVLAALGYDVSTDRVEGLSVGHEGPELHFQCVVWLADEPDQHEVDLLRKCLEPGGELVMGRRSAQGAGSFVEDRLRDWSVLERRVLVRAESGWQDVERHQPLSGQGDAVVELVRAVPRR